ncbi:MAG: response regulator transcription factor [Verrucomicrobia bacterium]|nr:response regulator transcription factor [Verrucomicrobiota bacterium]
MPAAIYFEEETRGGQVGAALGRLTPRQHEILLLLAKGFYYKEIGAALGISHSTVRAHLHSVYRKLEVKSRSRAVIKFHEMTQQHHN